jgi:hypothetical protein
MPEIEAPDFDESVPVNEARLFRFSAATYNAHRIHYDLPYAQEVEKYPALVTHGPMQAIMLIDAATRHAARRRNGSGSAACTRCSTTMTCGCRASGSRGAGDDARDGRSGRIPWNDSGSGVGLMGILSGMRVVEGSAFVAVPLAGMTLAQMGADVIRFDRLEGGLDAGRWPVTQDGPEPVLGGAQQGQAVDRDRHEEPARREIISEIITAPGEDAGLFITNLRVRGWMDYETLSARRPDLCMVTLTGDRHGRPAVDYTVNPALGFPDATGPAGSTSRWPMCCPPGTASPGTWW